MKFCTVCRAEIKRNYLGHRQGVRHQYARKLLRWLADENISFADMSRRLRVSRERVRQLAALFPKSLTGRERQRRVAIRRTRETLTQGRGPISRVAREFNARGIAWHPVRRRNPYEFSERVMEIGPPPHLRCCAQRYGRKPTGYYYIAKAAKTICDFYLFVGPAGILVFPHEARPRGQTMFLLGRRRKAAGVPGARHDWGDYLNAWHLIEARLRQIQQKTK